MKHLAVLLFLLTARAWGFAPDIPEDKANAYAPNTNVGARKGNMDFSSANTNLALSLGTMTQYFRKVQTKEDGSKNNFKFNPYLAGTFQYALTPQFFLLPAFGFTFPKTSEDKSNTKINYFLLGEAGYRFSDFMLKAGPGLFMTYIKGKGGEQVLRNGTSSSSFPVPSGNSTARNVVLDLGLEWRFLPEFSAQLQTMIFNLQDSTARSVTYSLAMQYHLDLGLL